MVQSYMTKSMKKQTKMKNTSDVEFRPGVELRLSEIKTETTDVKAKSSSFPSLLTKSTSSVLIVKFYTELEMAVIISGIPENNNFNMKTEDVVMHENENGMVREILHHLGEKETNVTNNLFLEIPTLAIRNLDYC